MRQLATALCVFAAFFAAIYALAALVNSPAVVADTENSSHLDDIRSTCKQMIEDSAPGAEKRMTRAMCQEMKAQAVRK